MLGLPASGGFPGLVSNANHAPPAVEKLMLVAAEYDGRKQSYLRCRYAVSVVAAALSACGAQNCVWSEDDPIVRPHATDFSLRSLSRWKGCRRHPVSDALGEDREEGMRDRVVNYSIFSSSTDAYSEGVSGVTLNLLVDHLFAWWKEN